MLSIKVMRYMYRLIPTIYNTMYCQIYSMCNTVELNSFHGIMIFTIITAVKIVKKIEISNLG